MTSIIDANIRNEWMLGDYLCSFAVSKLSQANPIQDSFRQEQNTAPAMGTGMGMSIAVDKREDFSQLDEVRLTD